MDSDWSDSMSDWGSGQPSPLAPGALGPLEAAYAGQGAEERSVDHDAAGAQRSDVGGATTAAAAGSVPPEPQPPDKWQPDAAGSNAVEAAGSGAAAAVPLGNPAAVAPLSLAAPFPPAHEVPPVSLAAPPLAPEVPLPPGCEAAGSVAGRAEDPPALIPAAELPRLQQSQQQQQEAAELLVNAGTSQPPGIEAPESGPPACADAAQQALPAHPPDEQQQQQLPPEQQPQQPSAAPAPWGGEEAVPGAAEEPTAVPPAGAGSPPAVLAVDVAAEPAASAAGAACDPAAPASGTACTRLPCDAGLSAAAQSSAAALEPSAAAEPVDEDSLGGAASSTEAEAAAADATVVVAAASGDKECSVQPRLQELQVALVPQPLGPPLATYPVQQLQAVLGSGLASMRHRLTTAAQRESALRLETVDAAVEREALAQARAFAEAALQGERTARLAAEQELALLAAAAEEEQQQWEERFADGQEQLRAALSAARALERKVAELQRELEVERSKRAAAEGGMSRLQRELEEQRQQAAAAAAALAQQRQTEHQTAERQRRQHEEAVAAPAAAPEQPAPAGTLPRPASGTQLNVAGATDAVLLHHVLNLQQEVVALKGQQQQQQQVAHPPQQPQAAQPAAQPPAACPQAWQGWVGAAPPPQLPQWHSSAEQLPSLGMQPAPPMDAQGAGSPCRPTTARPLLAEVRAWLQQQQQQHQRQEKAAREQEEELVEQMLQAAAAGALGQQHGPPGPQYSPAACWGPQPSMGGMPACEPLAQQLQTARRPLHEPRQPVLAPAPGSGTKRRQLSSRPPSRWDYRPAWNEGLRVDDLPLASRARQAGAAGEPGSPKQQPRAGATAQAHAPTAWAAVPAPVLQQPTFPAQPQVQQAPQQCAAASSLAQPVLQPQPQLPAYQSAPAQPSPVLPPSGAAPGFSIGQPVIHQYFAGSPPPVTAVASPSGPWQQQWQQQWQHGWPPAAPDPLSRPVTAGVQQWQVAQPVASMTPPPALQGFGEGQPQWAGYGPPVQQQGVQPSGQYPQPWQQLGATQQQALQQVRPATPGAGLGLGSLHYESGRAGTFGSEAWQPPQAANAVNTPDPRSASAKDRPLAVAPTQVDEAALAAARAEYVRETARIRAKRLREMQESADFRL